MPALASSSCFCYFLCDLVKKVFSEVNYKDRAVIELGYFKGHLLSYSHTCSSDHYKTVLVKLEWLFFPKDSKKNVEKNDKKDKAANKGGEEIENILNIDH